VLLAAHSIEQRSGNKN